jgi:hypothetical protein
VAWVGPYLKHDIGLALFAEDAAASCGRAATRVIITEYNLPRKTIEPHDVIVDADGIVWFSNVGEQFVGKLDPKAGAASEYPVPTIRPGFPTGALDLETDLEGCRDSTRWPTQRQVRRRASSLAR